MHRRRFLVVGVAGAAALSAAGLWSWLSRSADPLVAETGAAEILASVVPVMLDGALPVAAPERGIAVRETVANVLRAIDGLLPASRAELAQLFALLALPVGRRALAGIDVPWREAGAADVEGFLAAWQSSGWALKRSAYDALHQLIHAAWYGNPRSWSTIGYPGPPPLG